MELNIVRHTRGYRWRVYKDGNLFCTGTDYHETEQDAENEALDTFCKAWDLDTKTKSEACMKSYESMREAKRAIESELKDKDFQTTRTFWVDGRRYIARKTNMLAGYVNLSIKEV